MWRKTVSHISAYCNTVKFSLSPCCMRKAFWTGSRPAFHPFSSSLCHFLHHLPCFDMFSFSFFLSFSFLATSNLSFLSFINLLSPPLCLLCALSLLGGGWLEVCCHGDWPHLPLGLCAGVCVRNFGALPATFDWLLLVINYETLTNNFLSHWHAPYLLVSHVPSLQQDSNNKNYTQVSLYSKYPISCSVFLSATNQLGRIKADYGLFNNHWLWNLTISEPSNHNPS